MTMQDAIAKAKKKYYYYKPRILQDPKGYYNIPVCVHVNEEMFIALKALRKINGHSLSEIIRNGVNLLIQQELNKENKESLQH